MLKILWCGRKVREVKRDEVCFECLHLKEVQRQRASEAIYDY